MKRKISIFLLAAMLATTCACGDTSSKQPDETSASGSSDDTTAVVTEDLSKIPPEATDKYKGKTYRIFNGY